MREIAIDIKIYKIIIAKGLQEINQANDDILKNKIIDAQYFILKLKDQTKNLKSKRKDLNGQLKKLDSILKINKW